MQAREKHAAEIESRLARLRKQYQEREAAKDKIIDLQLQVIESDAAGLGFPGASSPVATPEKEPAAENDGPDSKQTSDLEMIQGGWVSAACEMNGHKLDGQALKDFHFDPWFGRNRYVIRFGKLPNVGTFELDPVQEPKAITLNGDDGSVNLGIYAIVENRLRICIGEPNKERPTGFKTTEGSGYSLIEFERRPRVNEVRLAVDRFLKAVLAGDAEKARELVALSVSDEQIASFKGVAEKLSLADTCVSPGPAPTSYGGNTGRALVVTEELQFTDSPRGTTKGHLVLTLLKDDKRAGKDGWLVWDIDLKDSAKVDKEVMSFLERYDGE
jgi:uncharacterized protein (TIGR03067 family)